jgi:hypothetical protein
MAELAGHPDVRTTKGYVAVSSERKARAVRETFRERSRPQRLLGEDR